MKKKIIIFSIVILAILAGFWLYLCVNTTDKESDSEGNDVNVENLDYTVHVVINIQPLDNFSEEEAEKIAWELEELAYEQLKIAAEIYVLPAQPMQSKWLNERKSRYDACKLIDAFKNDCTYTILLLHKDISIPKYRGKTDWGVLGLTLQPGKTCVISDFRLKHKKKDMAKVILHEFIHAYYNYKHCPKDDAACIMKDAKGKADFSNKKSLCKECREQLVKRVQITQ